MLWSPPCSEKPAGLITYLCTLGADNSDTVEEKVGEELNCDAVSSVKNGVTGARELGRRRSEEDKLATKKKNQ